MDLRRRLISLITHTSGGDPIPAGCEIGTFTPETDEYTHTITHSLGQVPKTAYCFAVTNGAEWSSLPAAMIIAEEFVSDPATGAFDPTLSASHKRDSIIIKNPVSMEFYTTNTYTTYPASMTNSTVTFTTGRYYGGKLSAGITYIYILTK